jgi:hypothetical protein
VRAKQGAGNQVLATALAELEQSDLRGRLAALAASAASEEHDAEVTSPEVTSP